MNFYIRAYDLNASAIIRALTNNDRSVFNLGSREFAEYCGMYGVCHDCPQPTLPTSHQYGEINIFQCVECQNYKSVCTEHRPVRAEFPSSEHYMNLYNRCNSCTTAYLARLRLERYLCDKKNNATSQDTVDCSVCFESIDQQFYKLECEHEFHIGCLNSWTKTCNEKGGCPTCPMCRHAF